MRRAFLAWAAALLGACTNLDVAAVEVCRTDADCVDARCVAGRCTSWGDGGAPRDASDYCDGLGPPVVVGDLWVDRPSCGGAVAERTFRYALCACEDLASSTSLTTSSFHSGEAWSALGGSVGTNGSMLASAPVTLGGSLFVGGAGGVRAAMATVAVDGELRSAGPVLTEGTLLVGRDADVNGDVSASVLRVGGVLTLPSSASLSAGAMELGGEARDAVIVPPPCACADSDLLDVAALVRARASDHDGARAGIDPARLDGYDGDTRVELPCGRFYFHAVRGQGALTFVVRGRVAVYVAGDLLPGGPFTVELAPGAELDLFVEGILSTPYPVRFGDPDAPARARLYLGGSGVTELSDSGTFAGNVYAPRADVRASADLEVRGALFVRRLAASGDVTLRYDAAILDAGDACPDETPARCASCLDCRSSEACVDGACGACTSDADCCAPLVCAGGRCQPAPF
jgi:cytoskeletal protein CcmA (bactofilin family)